MKATGLISRYEIAARVRGNGFKIVFYPGEGFYQDYTDFYLKQPKRTAQLLSAPAPIRTPLQLVAYFHELLGHSHNNFTEKERGQAAELLKLYSDEEARALIYHAVREGKRTSFPMQFFGAVLGYQGSWTASRTKATCAICQGKGVIEVKDEQGMRMRVCTHGQTAPNSESIN